MKNTIKGFILGMVVCSLFFGSIALATDMTELRTLAAEFCGIQIDIDQSQFISKDATGKEVEPFIVDGTTYLPVRAIAEAFGKEVVWNDSLKKISIFTKSEEVTDAEVEKAFEEVFLSAETLQEYKVLEVKKEDTNTWHIKFNVLPKEGHEIEWTAGNGGSGENGWIIDKGLFVYVVKTDGVVDLRVMGTGL